jgi:hypothetical protein
MKSRIVIATILIVCFIFDVWAHLVVQPKSFEFYDKAGIVGITLNEDNNLIVTLNSFTLGNRPDFCELK